MSQKQINFLAFAYLFLMLVLDVRFRFGIPGIVLALVGFLLLVGINEIGPRVNKKWRRHRRSTKAFESSEHAVEDVKRLLSRPQFLSLAPPEVRNSLWRISSKLEQNIRVIRQDPDKHLYAESFAGNYAKPVHDAIYQYVTLTERDVASAKEELQRTERDLPQIERNLNDVFEAIHRGDVAELQGLNWRLELQDGSEK